jgi:hypothetical protein
MRSERARDSQIFVEIDSVDLNEMFLNLDVVRFPPGVRYLLELKRPTRPTQHLLPPKRVHVQFHPRMKQQNIQRQREHHYYLFESIIPCLWTWREE